MTNTNNNRMIHTKLYSKIAHEILDSVEGQLSDGMWENSPAMDKYWKFSNIKTAPDGEILIEVSNDSGYFDTYYKRTQVNGFYNMSDDEVINWFATKIKHIMQVELKDNNIKNGWKRDNDDFESGYLSYKETITVADVYFVYDFMKGRDVTKKYNEDRNLKIISTPKSDEETKSEEARRETINKLNNEHAAAITKLEAEYKEAIEKLNKELNDKRHELWVAHKAELDRLSA